MSQKPTNDDRWPVVLISIRKWLDTRPLMMLGCPLSALDIFLEINQLSGQKWVKLWPRTSVNFANILRSHHQELETEFGIQVSGNKTSGSRYVFPKKDYDAE